MIKRYKPHLGRCLVFMTALSMPVFILPVQPSYPQSIHLLAQSNSDIDDLRQELEIQNSKIESLMSEPWHSSPSVIISALALLFSFGTTLVSYYRSHKDDVRDARRELREVLQKLIDLPKEYNKIAKTLDTLTVEEQSILDSITQESSVLTFRAYEIVERYPRSISASEYYSVAIELVRSGIHITKVPEYFEKALMKTKSPLDNLGILRAYGNFLIGNGMFTEGRERFNSAIAIWREYPGVNDNFRAAQDCYTEAMWGLSELSINELSLAEEHLRKSKDKLRNILDEKAMAYNLKVITFLEKEIYRRRQETNTFNQADTI